jgi:antitoxin MazE
MKTTAKIVPIGNSKGIRLPKRLIEDLNLTDTVELESRGNELVIRPIESPHEGWEASAKAMRRRGDDMLLLGNIPAPDWDEKGWEW